MRKNSTTSAVPELPASELPVPAESISSTQGVSTASSPTLVTSTPLSPDSLGTHTSTVRPKRRDVREAILRAAISVFSREGYDGASLERIAAEAGFTKGAIYSNFGSKLTLFVEVIQQRFDSESGGIVELLSVELANANKIETIVAHLASEIVAHLDTFIPLQVALAQFRSHAASEVEVQEAYAELYENRVQAILSLCRGHHATARISEERLRLFTLTLLGLVNTFCLELAARPGTPAHLRSHEEILRLALQGVLHGR